MVPNYPYFGLPNYMNYMKKNCPDKNFKYAMVSNNYNVHNPNRFSNYSSPKSFNYNTSFSKRARAGNSNVNSGVVNGNINANFNVANGRSNVNNNSNVRNSADEDFSKINSSPIFSLLGINLYFDDILIVCLLLFLYNEKVDDYFLMMVLALLLFS